MASIDFKQEHSLPLDEVKEKTEKFLAKLNKNLGVKYEWKTDHFAIKSTGLKGTVKPGKSDVHVVVDVGLAMRPMKGMIEDIIKKGLSRLAS